MTEMTSAEETAINAAIDGTPLPEPMTVHQAVVAVMGDIREIGKDSRNAQQGFMFRGIDSVVNAVGPLLRKWGVIIRPFSTTIHEIEHYTTKNGTAMVSARIVQQYAVSGPQGDTFICEVPGEASDSGDKSVSKAMSIAWRTVLIQLLCIPTNDEDPDARSHERGSAVSTDRGEGIPLKVSETEAASQIKFDLMVKGLRDAKALAGADRIAAIAELKSAYSDVLTRVISVEGVTQTLETLADSMASEALL